MTLLVVDVSCLAWRSFHVMRDLAYGGHGTGAVYGTFRTVLDLMELYDTDRVAWCFDGGCDYRRQVYSGYKRNRRAVVEEEADRRARRELRRQLYRLRTSYLRRLGFRNVFYQEGCEADDMIAAVCEALPRGQEAVIVSSDGDLYQLLGPRVTLWNPATGKPVNEEAFWKRHGVGPTMWSLVKAMAGCSGDGVPGIQGVGEKTAVKYIQGRLKPASKAFKAIVAGDDIVRRNLLLVRLPHPATRPVVLRQDVLSQEAWLELMDSLGMRTLRGRRLIRGQAV